MADRPRYDKNIFLQPESSHHSTVVMIPESFSQSDIDLDISTPVRITHIFSSYPGNIYPDSALENLMLKTKLEGFKLMIMRKMEPNLLWDDPLITSRNIFEVIHTCVEKTGFPIKDLVLYVGNNSVNKSYDMWCGLHRIPKRNRLTVRDSHFWMRGVNNTYTEVNCYTGLQNKIRSKYFTCFNGRMRYQKKDIARHFYNTGYLNTHKKDKAYLSFVFDNTEQDDPFYQANPGLWEALPRSIEENKPYHPHSKDWDSLRVEIMATDEFSRVQQDSYFDLTVEFVQNEDWWWPDYTTARKNWPWWFEHCCSEKVIRNVKNRRPFIIIGEPFLLDYMAQHYNFKSFDFLFDESYDKITDYTTRYRNVLHQVTSLCERLSLQELHDIIYSPQMEDVLEHNYEMLKQFGPIYDKKETQELLDLMQSK